MRESGRLLMALAVLAFSSAIALVVLAILQIHHRWGTIRSEPASLADKVRAEESARAREFFRGRPGSLESPKQPVARE